MGYNIYIRDSQFNRIGEITDFNKLEIIPRFNNVGSFVLDLPTDTPAAKELIKNKRGIIVRRDGRTLFSGTVTSQKRSFSVSGDNMTFAGKDDNQVLATKVAYPVPNGDFSLSDYDVRTGTAGTVMMEYVDYNAGNNALSERRDLILGEDLGIGSIVTGRARFHNLLELLRSLALSGGGLGFNVVQEGNKLVFKVYQPNDSSKLAFFSPLLGNLSSFDYSSESPEANFVIVGGGGQGKDRLLLSKADNASIVDYGRIETFVDRRDTSELTELEQSLDEELVNKGEKKSLSFTPIDTPQLRFQQHYGLGDKVSVILTQPNEVVDIETLYYFISAYQTVPVQVEKIRKIQEKLMVIQDIVREVKIVIDGNGEIVNPSVGNEDSLNQGVMKIFDQMKKMNKRINHLERV